MTRQTVRRRLDLELVRRGLVPSRAHARDVIARGAVLVGGAVADKASRLVAGGDPIVIDTGGRRFVSRGGDKLDAALERFPIPVVGRRCLDAGASTGGFTDCLLQRGAASVTAVDVGYGQLHPRLRDDGRVLVRERTNVRSLGAGDGVGDGDGDGGGDGERFALIVADLSFISLTTVAPVLVGLAAPGADLVVLVKPQFEVGHIAASRGRGVVRDQDLRRTALGRVASALEQAGATIMGAMASPVLGPAGNAEYLLWGRIGPFEAPMGLDVAAVLDAAVASSPDAAVQVLDPAGTDGTVRDTTVRDVSVRDTPVRDATVRDVPGER
ncbi:MAG TPA: TlyA family RNA methyltransferase [Acidimicrobiales bacterium]|nr:TlyA family RNA methyltransferase [Acidimicrobiales bacterium]